MKHLTRSAAVLMFSLFSLGASAQAPQPSETTTTEAAPATEQQPPQTATGSEVERKIDVLAAEIEKLRLGEVVPKAEGSEHGFGPAASKVYRTEHGVTLGGYGEALYRNYADAEKDDTFDFLRAILYVGYKFSDKFVLNTEIEVEHADEIYVEFAYVDYLWRPELGFRGGMLLIPMGLINELHEPTVFLGALRPETEQRILPTTWRENGVGVFGDLGPVTYRAYLLNGLKGSGFTGAGFRGGRQKGAEAIANDFAGVARVDYTGVPGLLVGGSVYYGGSGQQLDVDVPTLIYEAHLDYKWRGLEVRGLYARSSLDNVADLNTELELEGNASVGEAMQGWYGQVGFDVLSLVPNSTLRLVPFVRYEDIDTQLSVPGGFASNPSNDNQILTVGANFYPIDEIVVKAEYQNRSVRDGDGAASYNVLLGYIF